MTLIQPTRLWQKILAWFFILTVACPPSMVLAAGPAWWTEQEVITSGATADDYAAINQGQLKLLVTKAVGALDAHLPAGAGTTLHGMVSAWSTPSASSDDYAAVNLGQLKAVAQPIYDQLIATGYANGYPWTGASTSADDYALANIGQAKNLFSFDLSAGPLGGPNSGTGVTPASILAPGSSSAAAGSAPAAGGTPPVTVYNTPEPAGRPVVRLGWWIFHNRHLWPPKGKAIQALPEARRVSTG